MGSGIAKTVALAAVLALAGACGTPPVPETFQDQAVHETEYRIAPSDVLEIRVWKNPELSILAPVLPDGSISAPLAGTVPASDLTAAELEDVLAQRLLDYITAPEVSVVVKEVNSKRVSVLGEVNRPGWQNLAVNTRVVDAIATAGGFSTYANRKKIRVIRSGADGGELQYRFNYDRFRSGKAPGTNVLLQAGDVIVVPD